MNIFFLDKDPVLCAQYHVDKHVVKMIVEYAQILSTVKRKIDGRKVVAKSEANRSVTRWVLDGSDEEIFYKSTHQNHPSTIWAGQSKANYLWLQSLLVAVSEEFEYRRQKEHQTKTSGLIEVLATPPYGLMNCTKPFTDPTPAMEDIYLSRNSMESYRKYYREKKIHLHQWSGRSKPEWI